MADWPCIVFEIDCIFFYPRCTVHTVGTEPSTSASKSFSYTFDSPGRSRSMTCPKSLIWPSAPGLVDGRAVGCPPRRRVRCADFGRFYNTQIFKYWNYIHWCSNLYLKGHLIMRSNFFGPSKKSITCQRWFLYILRTREAPRRFRWMS